MADDLRRFVEGNDGIAVIRKSATCRDWNGIQYKVGLKSFAVNIIE